MRNNNPQQPKQPGDKPESEKTLSDNMKEAFAALLGLQILCPKELPSIIAELPQPKNPAQAHALLTLIGTVARFDVGRLVRSAEFAAWTDEGIDEDEAGGETHTDRNGWVSHCLARHWAGDWGELDDEDKQANEDALKHGTRILSAYTHANTGERIWIITEGNRKMTTFLFPHEY
jgi:hypothetical protein